jgi:hypothetical protein
MASQATRKSNNSFPLWNVEAELIPTLAANHKFLTLVCSYVQLVHDVATTTTYLRHKFITV